MSDLNDIIGEMQHLVNVSDDAPPKLIKDWVERLTAFVGTLADAYTAGYREGFTDGYAFFPDLGHGKVEGE